MACCSAVVVAEVDPEPGSAFNREFIEGPEWQEEGGGQVVLPNFPDEAGLLDFQVDDPAQAFTYGIDPASLSVGEDGVVRYTVVLKSRAGARNVFFEGIRCQTLEYKTYAHGTPEDRFQALRAPAWQGLSKSGSGRYRFELHTYFLCDRSHQPLPEHVILRRLRAPEHAQPHLYEGS